MFRHQANLFHPHTEDDQQLGFVKEVNISHIDSDSEEEPEQEEVKVSVMESPVKPGTSNIKIEDESSPPIKSGIAKRMVISKFYPPSNRQESISIDEIEDSSVLKENKESFDNPGSVAWESQSDHNNIKIEGDERNEFLGEEMIPRDTCFKKKVPDFMDRSK